MYLSEWQTTRPLTGAAPGATWDIILGWPFQTRPHLCRCSSRPPSRRRLTAWPCRSSRAKAQPPHRGWIPATRGEVGRALGTGEFTGKIFETFLAPTDPCAARAARVALIGAGPRATYDAFRARRLATSAAIGARDRRVTRLAIVPTGAVTLAEEGQAIAEGLRLADYQTSVYKTDADSRKPTPSYQVVVAPDLSNGLDVAFRDAVQRGDLLGRHTNIARELANEPANRLNPQTFAERTAQLATGTSLSVDVLDEQQIAGLGMGMLQGVAQGSQHPPRIVVLHHTPDGSEAGRVLGLVGKGITFDTGGISIKPSDGLFRMKTDMSGGAAVVGAMLAVAALAPKLRVVGVVPLAENMPGGRAMRPGDVVRSAEGKTVEVLDTDAEGRLLLGDGLWYARRLGATHLVDVATLTGSVQVALGRTTSGLLGGPPWWLDSVARTANRAGDRCWVLPTFEDYRELLRSEIADLANIGGRAAGAITAALFLKEFTGGLPWAHIDVAGTAWADEPQPFQPKGPTGVGVRALAELACCHDEWMT